MAVVGAGFFLVLKVGFLIHHEPAPAPFDSNGLTAAAAVALFAGALVTGQAAIRWSGKAVKRAEMRRDARANAALRAEARRKRAAELAADPLRARYAPLVERGEDWTDEKIAYNEDADATTTCGHLQPIERAMRRAGISVRMTNIKNVSAQCRIDDAALKRAFGPPPVVRYAEFFQDGPGARDFPAAFLICDEHHSIIHTRHPFEAHASEMPLFPASEI
jgi:transposase InsO family protein